MKPYSSHKIFVFFFAAFFTLAVISIWLLIPSKSSYESFLASHPYQIHNADLGQSYDQIPKRDRPDLAWQQRYLATMNPELKRPTPEKLVSVRKELKNHFRAQKGERTGTQEYPWVERGPSNIGGRTRAVMWDPNDATGKKVWAGGVTGGLWYTNDIYDANEKWNSTDDFWDNISIACIAYDPTNTNVFYVGTGEGFGVAAGRGAGIWKTTDGGSSWSPLAGTQEFYYVNDLLIRNENGIGVLYAAVRANYYQGDWHGLDYQGLQRSTDGGSTFTQVMSTVPGENIVYAIADLELGADSRIWAGSQDNAYSANNRGGGSILYSDDGTSWTLSTQRSNAARVELATAPSDASVVYALIESDYEVSEVIKTTDQGSSWSSLEEPNDADDGIAASDFTRGQAFYDLIAIVDPNDANTVLVGGIDLFKSNSGGSSWQQISHWYGGYGFPNVHADQHAMAFKPGSSTDILFGNDGGMYISTNMTSSSPSFTNRNNNYNITQFYAAAIHPDAGRDYFLAGAQDNGTQRFQSAGLNSTTEAYGGDGAYCFIDQKNGDIQIVSYVNNVYSLSTNGGDSFTDFVGDQNTGLFINPADYDDNQGILYSSSTATSLARFVNVKSGSPTRNDLSINLGSYASNLKVSPYTTSSTTLFVGTQAGRLFKITNADGSNSEAEITGFDFPDGNISSIEFGASEEELIVTFSNYGVNSVWFTTNGGSIWKSKEGNLPDMPVSWALINPNNSEEVILATDLGIWRTEDFSSNTPTWMASNEGLANVRVDMLQIRESDHEVIAATHGRGLYSSSGFSGATASGLNALFSASSSNIEIGESVTFTDTSTGTPTSWSWSFEGGNPATSSEQNPTVEYASAGTYDVTLVITNAQNESSTKTIENMITVIEVGLPNLAFYKPDDWANAITLSNIESDYSNPAQLAADGLYLSYAVVNSGDDDISSSFENKIIVDDQDWNTFSWDFTLTDPLNAGYYTYQNDVLLDKLEIGEHTIQIVLDANSVLSEGDETDNTMSYTFYVQESCTGTSTQTEETGTLEDGSGGVEYLNNLDCEWTIAPEGAGSITISFSEFDIEADYDFLYIYKGSDLSTALSELTGSSLPNELTIDEGEAVLQFVTDEDIASQGWKLSYTSEKAILNVGKVGMNIYPNPVMDVLSITGINDGTYSLTDIMGKTIDTGSILGDAKIDMVNYSVGIYVLTIESEAGISVHKIKKAN